MAREAIRSAVTIGSVTLPPRLAWGEAWLDTDASVKLDEKKAAGKNGSRQTIQGRDDSPIAVEVRVHPTDYELLREALRVLWLEAQAGPGKVVHANAELFGITAVQVQKITAPKRNSDGEWVASITGKGWAGAPEGEGCKLLLLRGSTDATTGKEVSRWQTFLLAQGYDPQGIDGIFGTNTDAATRLFQTAQAITVDGIVGPETFGKAALLGYALPSADACKSATKTATSAKPAAPANAQDWGPPLRYPDELAEQERARAQEWVTADDGVGEP